MGVTISGDVAGVFGKIVDGKKSRGDAVDSGEDDSDDDFESDAVSGNTSVSLSGSEPKRSRSGSEKRGPVSLSSGGAGIGETSNQLVIFTAADYVKCGEGSRARELLAQHLGLSDSGFTRDRAYLAEADSEMVFSQMRAFSSGSQTKAQVRMIESFLFHLPPQSPGPSTPFLPFTPSTLPSLPPHSLHFLHTLH